MKKHLYITLLLFSICISGQVGIGTTTPHSSAALDVASSTSRQGGVLLPKVALDDALDSSTIPNPARGLLVYNLANAGIGVNAIVANNIYLWDGLRWKIIADMEQAKKTLLPPVFFAQSTSSQIFTAGELANINNGTGVVVTFATENITANNGQHIELINDEFIIKTAGQYELSAYINYCPRLDGTTGFSNLDFKIQRSDNNGTNWTTIATTREVWGENLGQYYRSAIMPPSIVQNLNINSRLRLVISRGTDHGMLHGSGSGAVSIGQGAGITYPKSIKFLKLD